MEFNLALIHCGCISAIVFFCVLLTSRYNSIANRFLSFLVLSLGLNLFLSKAIELGYFDSYPMLHLLPFGVGFGLGPLIYLYIQSLCVGKKQDFWHLLWLLMDYPHNIYHIIYGRSVIHEKLHTVLDQFGFLAVIVIGFYLWKSRSIILQYQNQLRDKLSNVERQTLNWLKQLNGLFLLSIPMAFALWLLRISVGLDFNHKLIGHVYYVVAIFWLGIGGIRQPEIISPGIEESRVRRKLKTIPDTHLRLLVSSMEIDKLYLLPDLNVRILEDRLGLSAKQISEALNQGLNKNFYEFINGYRVEEFKKKARENPHLTLVGIAIECGFNSKTTFQRVFKEITGMRPSEFIDS